VKGYDADFSLVMWAPKQVPDELVQKFRQALLDGLKLPETAERLKATDQLVIGSTPEEAAARIAKDYAKWGAVTKKIGLSLEWNATWKTIRSIISLDIHSMMF